MEISFEKGKFVYCPGGFNYQEVLDDFKRAKKVRIITYNISGTGNTDPLRRFTKGYYIKQLKMDCQPTEFTALSRHRAVFSWAGKGGIPICGA